MDEYSTTINMNDINFNLLAEEWYRRRPVLYELVKLMKAKEVAFLKPKYEENLSAVRGMKIHNIEFLKLNMKAFNFCKRKFNIYVSCASLHNMPSFNFNYVYRKIELKKFREVFQDYLIGYDLLLDFDSKEHGLDRCYMDTGLIKQLFDDYQVPYYIMFSGSGFHIKVPYEYLETPEGNQGLDMCKLISKGLAETFDLESLDLSVYDMRRVAKVPYSIDFNTDNVAWPMSDYEFNHFEVEDMHITNKINVPLTNRGVLLRNKDKDITWLKREIIDEQKK